MKYVKEKKGRMERKRGVCCRLQSFKGNFLLNIAAVVRNELYFFRVVKSSMNNEVILEAGE